MNLLNLDRNAELPMGTTLLCASAGLTCHLGFYREGSAQGLHSHPTPTVSLLLGGTVHEMVAGSEVSAGASSISIKPPDVRHSDVYGRHGAVTLSVAIHDPNHWAAVAPSPEWTWRPLIKRDFGEVLASFAEPDRLCDATFELLALGTRVQRRKGTPPRWLRTVEEQLSDRPDLPLSVVAAGAGVHPVYLARAFRGWYGVSPSAYRLVQRTSAAIGAALWSGKAASAIAHDVGFADQSHMARSIRSATGHSLSELRRMAARALKAGLLTAALLAAAAVAATSAATAAGLSPTRIAKIDSAVTALIGLNHIPGVSIAVASGGELLWQKAYGFADVENELPATTSTVYRLASTSKPLTAVAALRLAEAGKLDLDAPVQKYAPTFPTKAQVITPRQLLGHLSGIRHYRRGEGERTDHYDNLTAALAVFAGDSLENEPGARFTYTTFGYTLLGVAIEGASGKSFAETMRELVFEPAGMKHTRVDDVNAIVPHRAHGYSPLVYGKFDGQWKNATLMDPSYKSPGGGILSTAEDLVRFAIALQGGGLLGKDALRQMSTSGKTRDGAETGYGYGWYVERLDGPGSDLVIHHGGVQPGFSAELWTLPEKRFAVAILTNLEGGGRLGLAPLARDIAGIVLEDARRPSSGH